MQPVPNKVNVDDTESLFDFLDADDDKPANGSEGGATRDSGRQERAKSASRSSRSGREDKPFPVIRKPVCVTQTGALRPPRPGDPVEPPPPLTDGLRAAPPPRPDRGDIDLSDLDDINLELDEDDWPGSDQWVDQTHRAGSVEFEDQRPGPWRTIGYGLAGLLIISGALVALYSVPSVRSWVDSTTGGFIGAASDKYADGESLTSNDVAQVAAPLTPVNANAPKTLNVLFREELSGLELMLEQGSFDEAEMRIQTMDRAVFGYGAPEFTEIRERIVVLKEGGNTAAQASETQLVEQERVDQARILEEQRIAAELEAQRQAEAEREAAQALAAEQELAAAEAERLAVQRAERQREIAEAEQLALQQAEREREIAEAEQLALQQAEREREIAEAEQLALQQAEREREIAEAEQLALQQAEREKELAENQRLAAQQAEQERAAEAQRLEIQRARDAAAEEQIRADRIAQEQARQEQLAVARQERSLLEQRLVQQQTAEQAAAAAAYQTETWQALTPQQRSESVQNLAASQREAARQQRLIDARARSAQGNSVQTDTNTNTDTAAQVQPELVIARVEPTVLQPVEPVSRAITDSDLQTVYGQFAQLQSAIQDRDVNAVIRLTERSGVRIQQIMQMFENNVSIQTQLRNVSTLDASGEIQGTLQITRLVRADGSVTGPPLNLGSVRLSSVRKGDGWSSIRW